ncbi:hypothetical protein AGMMS50230_18370 [Spirochaetia bacterium]|nr:hypothetical protein AGMMS50230_18370 [Spirochaetia bacterium]
MNKVLFFGLFLFVGVICFTQELEITSVGYNGEFNWYTQKPGQWPYERTIKSQWDELISKYKLIELSSDPFNRNVLADRISNLAIKSIPNNIHGGHAYTVYLTMGSRRFICFLYDLGNPVDGIYYYSWAHEVNIEVSEILQDLGYTSNEGTVDLGTLSEAAAMQRTSKEKNDLFEKYYYKYRIVGHAGDLNWIVDHIKGQGIRFQRGHLYKTWFMGLYGTREAAIVAYFWIDNHDDISLMPEPYSFSKK